MRFALSGRAAQRQAAWGYRLPDALFYAVAGATSSLGHSLEMAVGRRLWYCQPGLAWIGYCPPARLVCRLPAGYPLADPHAVVDQHRRHADDHLPGRVAGHPCRTL